MSETATCSTAICLDISYNLHCSTRRFAASSGVHLMTFDNEDELYKTKSYDPSAKMVLRILADDPMAICNVRFKK